MDEHICLSGGAIGSDLQWGMTAGMRGHQVIHWTFDNHRSNAPKSEIVRLPQNLLDDADPFCIRASKTLKRRFPTKSLVVSNLLRRNWYQVANADACYAVSQFDKDGYVEGGTAWATQMFIDRHNGEACPCYVFDQGGIHEGRWMEWNGDAGWLPIYQPPEPEGIWAGVGTRDLNWFGKLAIRILMNYQPKKKV